MMRMETLSYALCPRVAAVVFFLLFPHHVTRPPWGGETKAHTTLCRLLAMLWAHAHCRT